VAEADEFDRSFLQLFPQIAVITATDADHLDIYGTADEMKKAFEDFANQVKPGGALIVKKGIDLSCEERRTENGERRREFSPFPLSLFPFSVFRYSLDQPCDFYASNIRRLDSGLSQFDLHLLDTVIPDCVMGIPGWMNVENAVAAAAATFLYLTSLGGLPEGLGESPEGFGEFPAGLGESPERLGEFPEGLGESPERLGESPEGLGESPANLGESPEGLGESPASRRLRAALSSFIGVQRRFDIQLHTPTRTYVDDYAHHPEELRAAITSLRETYPQRKITGIFQPHLYSRTRDFAGDFAKSLDLLDRLILLEIYPAREAPTPGITSQIIFDRMALQNKVMCSKDNLMDLLAKETVDVLATFGAGDIDRFVAPITALLKQSLK
jgi:UDP-N-acetylmuramate-alanine ligase